MRRTFAIIGPSGSGKTRLVSRLVRHLRRRGVRVGTIKHAHEGFEIDRPGKDSYRHYESGAERVVLTGPRQTAIIERHKRRRRVRDLLKHFADCDVVLVEGFKSEGLPAIEVFRKKVSARPLYSRIRVRAVVTRDPVKFKGPVFDPDDAATIASYILA